MNSTIVKGCALIPILALLVAPASLRGADKKAKEKTEAKPGFLEQYNDSIVAITKKTIPTVVNISAIKEAPKGDVYEYDSNGNPLKKFPFKPMEPKATGSGVIIDKRGYIVTNYHVIKDTRMIRATLSDRRELSCSILGIDPATDIALIKINGTVPSDLPVAEMGDSDKLQVGALVIAIGNPFGFSHTVTTGIISATGRQSVGLADYENYIQTDAAINPGNSGGALINIDGKLIGINTAIFSRSGGYMGIGFAIPSNMVKEVMNELITKGKVVRGWLGVYIQDVTKDIADSFKYDKEAGALVSDIIKGSPAEGTGIQKGDIIISVDGTVIKDVNNLRRIISLKKPGTQVKVNVFRGGKTMDIPITIGVLPDKPPVMAGAPSEKADALGMSVRDIDEEMAYKFRLSERTGVVVTQVRQESPAEKAGLMAGDVIKEVERSPVESVKDYDGITGSLKGKKKVLLLIARAGAHKFVIVDMSTE